MMTTVIDDTTDAVVPSPRLCVLGLTLSPQWQPTRAISVPNTTDFDSASVRLPVLTALGSACRK